MSEDQRSKHASSWLALLTSNCDLVLEVWKNLVLILEPHFMFPSRDFTQPNSKRKWPPPLNEPAKATPLGDGLALVLAGYNVEWRQHLSDLLSLPLSCIPKSGSASGEPAPLTAGRRLDKRPSLQAPSRMASVRSVTVCFSTSGF